jgi:hypothetical protein
MEEYLRAELGHSPHLIEPSCFGIGGLPFPSHVMSREAEKVTRPVLSHLEPCNRKAVKAVVINLPAVARHNSL